MSKARGGGVVVTGIKQIDRKLAKLAYKAQRTLVRKAIDTAMTPMLHAAQANAPVLTGDLKGATKLRSGKSRKGRVIREIKVGDRTSIAGEYAAAQEFGSKHNAPHPFLGPAFEGNAQKATATVEREILEGLLKAASAGTGGLGPIRQTASVRPRVKKSPTTKLQRAEKKAAKVAVARESRRVRRNVARRKGS